MTKNEKGKRKLFGRAEETKRKRKWEVKRERGEWDLRGEGERKDRGEEQEGERKRKGGEEAERARRRKVWLGETSIDKVSCIQGGV